MFSSCYTLYSKKNTLTHTAPTPNCMQLKAILLSLFGGGLCGWGVFLLYKEHSQKIVSHYTSNFSFISVPPHLFNCSNHICCVLFTFIMLSSLFDAYINSVMRLTSVCVNHNWVFFRGSFSRCMHAVVQAFLRRSILGCFKTILSSLKTLK